MARNFDAEIAAALAKVERIRKAKAAAEKRASEAVGKAAIDVFGSELLSMSQAELKGFFSTLSNAEEQPAQSVVSDVSYDSGYSDV